MHNLELIGVFLKSQAVHSLPAQLLQALEWFPPGPRSRGVSFPQEDVCPKHSGMHPQAAPMPFCADPFHLLSVNTLKIAFPRFSFPPLLQFSGLP